MDHPNITKNVNTFHAPEDNSLSLYAAITVGLSKWASLILVILGLFCNGFIVFLVGRPKLRGLAMSIYFACLAITDSGYLIAYFFKYPLKHLSGYDINTAHRGSCAVLRYLTFASYTASSFIVLVISIERSLIVLRPLKAATYSNVRKSKITMLAVLSMIAIVGVYNFIISDLTMTRKGLICNVQRRYKKYNELLRFPLISMVSAYIPLAILIICNCLMTWKLAVARRKRALMTSNKTNKSEMRLTLTAVTLCTTFCVLSVPTQIILVWATYAGWKIHPTPLTTLLNSCAPFLGAMRACVNFFIYICTSSIFRAEICSCLRINNSSKEQFSGMNTGKQVKTISSNRETLDPGSTKTIFEETNISA